MMERLNEYIEAQKFLETLDWDDIPNSCEPLETICDALQEIQKYKDLEEQGLLLRLPCPIETEVWEIEKQFWIDRKGCRDCIYFGNDGLGDYCDYDEDNYPACTKIVPKKFNMRMLKDFDETVFLTQSEAEKKLKEMEG